MYSPCIIKKTKRRQKIVPLTTFRYEYCVLARFPFLSSNLWTSCPCNDRYIVSAYSTSNLRLFSDWSRTIASHCFDLSGVVTKRLRVSRESRGIDGRPTTGTVERINFWGRRTTHHGRRKAKLRDFDRLLTLLLARSRVLPASLFLSG